ncbi:MAG: hypothetical protein ACLQU2_21650 [Candidatus Binataceae bacterium]
MAQTLLDRFDISADDLSSLQECGHVLGTTTSTTSPFVAGQFCTTKE